MNRKFWLFFTLMMLVAAVVFGELICTHTKLYLLSDPLDYLGGPESNVYSPVEMLWWLLIYSPLWAGCGFLMETQKQCLNLRLYRYKSLKQWWYPFVLQIYVLNLLWFVLLALLLMLHGLKAPGISVAIFCICFHSIFMLSVMIYIYVFTRNAAIAFIVLILCEAASVIFTSMGIPPAAMPLVWGMYRYSYERYGAGGFWLTEMTAMMLVLILPVFLLPAIKRGKEWLLR